MKTIRWGIIGCGDVTEVKSGPGFQNVAHSALVAVMRRNGDLAQDYARRHRVPRWYDDADRLINDPEVDAVYIATPPDSHRDYTLAVAQVGKPVYVEKPMARTHAECVQMVSACRQAGVPLFVAYYRRMLPRFLKVKELIAQGAIGEPRFTTVTLYQRRDDIDHANLPWRVIPQIAGAGIFLDLASHTLDMLDYILQPINAVSAFAANQAGEYRAEDIVSGTWVHESGVQGMGVWCFTAFRNFDQNEIIGSEGKLTFSTFGTEPVVLTIGDTMTEFPLETPQHVQQPLIQTIMDDLNGVGSCPSTGESAARTSWVLDQMLATYREQYGTGRFEEA